MFFFLFIFFASSYAQSLKNRAGTIFQKATLRIDRNLVAPVEVRFEDDQQISVSVFFDQYRKAFVWSVDNEAISFKEMRDDLGQTHHRFKQYYKGIELAEVQYLVHEKDGSVVYAHGKMIHGLNLDVSPILSEKQALQKALDHIGASLYMWENKKNEALLKKHRNNTKETYYPKGELKISSGLKQQAVENFKLVYRFDIFAEKPMSRNYVDVDAKNGEIVGVLPRMYSDDVPGSGTTLYDGDVDIIVSDENYDNPEDPVAHFHVDDWNAYGGSGNSWWLADTTVGTAGGYSDNWYEVLDTDPVNLFGEQVSLTFRHRLAAEPPSPANQMPEGYDGWDGINVRISVDNGDSWQVLANPTPIYSNESLYGFGYIHGEGEGIPGWTGVLETWIDVSFDLSTYIGNTVIIRFAFASDGGASTEFSGDPDWFGWQIDDIIIANLGDTLFANNGIEGGLTPANIVREAQFISGRYRLRESGRGGGIATFNSDNNDVLWQATDFVDDDSIFADSEDYAGVSTHWAAENTYDYFLEKHDRNSFDNEGSRIVSYVNYGVDWFNAQWMGSFMRFGGGDATNGYRSLVGVDIVGHEFSHGVTQFSAGLIYQDQYGALNESFSDIFGEHIESYALDGGHDWLMGDDSGALRSFTTPNAYGQPDTYLGNLWYTGNDDNGGVHINSGVQNFWFYLLSVGGSGTNDFGESYTIESIGMEDAAKIAYRNLTVYLMPTSEYEDARRGSLNAAIDLFGVNSSQFIAVLDAWNAVGVYYPFIGPYPEIPTIISPGNDTLYVQSTINNPKEHELEVKTIIESFDHTITDTILMHDDGLHQDNKANDGVFGCYWPVPLGERNYSMSTTTVSLDSGYSNILKEALYFTTTGPVSLELVEITSEDSVVNPGDLLIFEFTLKNFGQTETIFNVSSKTIALDECTEIVAFPDPEYGNIAPGESSLGSLGIRIRFNECPAPAEISFVQNIYSDDKLFWNDTFTVDIVAAIADLKTTVPAQFTLSQNFPNPFNPTTIINFELPITNNVELSIYNLVGQKVATLVNEQKKAGSHQVEWDASKFSSGVYYYILRTNLGFVQTRKMVLLR
jgi:Zn-dependent metalloprotease